MASMTPNALLQIGRQFVGERDRWPLWIPVLLGIGISIYFSLSVEYPLWIGLLTVAATAATAAFFRQRPAALIALLALMFVSLGYAAAQIRTVAVGHEVLTQRHGPATVTGQIVRLEAFPDSLRITLRNPRISNLAPRCDTGTGAYPYARRPARSPARRLGARAGPAVAAAGTGRARGIRFPAPRLFPSSGRAWIFIGGGGTHCPTGAAHRSSGLGGTSAAAFGSTNSRAGRRGRGRCRGPDDRRPLGDTPRRLGRHGDRRWRADGRGRNPGMPVTSWRVFCFLASAGCWP